MNQLKKLLPGAVLVLFVATVAFVLGEWAPLVGGPIFGILLGLLVNNLTGKPRRTEAGVAFSSKYILQVAVVLLGCGLSLTQVAIVGRETLPIMLATLAAALTASFLIGRWMKLSTNVRNLIGVGTAICGGSAIATVSPIIEAEETEIAYSVSVIFLFNMMAAFLFPALGHLFGYTDHQFGVFAGTAVNDTSSVIAAGYAYSDQAGDFATIVKMSRSMTIIPVSIGFAIISGLRKKRTADSNDAADHHLSFSWRKIVPTFIILFLIGSLMNTLGVFNESVITALNHVGKFCIVVALSAVGLSADFRKMARSGFRPFVFGFLVWIVVIAVSMAMIAVTSEA